VRKAGNRVRITAQLIDARSDRHLWSETYERELDDIFNIQEEISRNIVDALKVALNVNETEAMEHAQRPTENTEAYELYLQGRFAWRQRHEENIRKAIALFEKALALDPDFARAHEGLASAWGVLPSWSDLTPNEVGPMALEHATRALELDPTLSEARAIMAEFALAEHRWANAIAQYRQAIADAPRDPTLHQWLAEALAPMGYLSEALEEILTAYAIDPASPVVNQSIVWIAGNNRRDDMVLKHIEISKSLGVGAKATWLGALTLMRHGKTDTVLAAIDQRPGEPQQRDLARTYVMTQCDPARDSNLPERLDHVIATTAANKLDRMTIFCLADTGQAERAAQLIGQAASLEDYTILSLFWSSSPEGGVLRQTGAFRQILADFGLLDYYRQAGWPDLCHPLGDDDFECDP